MGLTVVVRVEHLAIPSVYQTAVSSDQSKLLLAPNLPHAGTVKSTIKEFVHVNLDIPHEQQLLLAPLFRRLNDFMCVEEVHKRYVCQPEVDECELYVDEERLVFYGREKGSVELLDEATLQECNILDKCVVELKRAPQPLSHKGGRLFVETKDGMLSLLGVSGYTPVSSLKEAIEKQTGIPKSQQLLSSVGRVMHDDFFLKDFDGVHAIYEDSIVDLTVSGAKNKEQAHRRFLVNVSVAGHEDMSLVVQGRDLVENVINLVEARMGIPQWQQRISYSGKPMESKKALADYMIQPQCTLRVTVFQSPRRVPPSENRQVESDDYTPAARKLKMVRTCQGRPNGTLVIPVLTSDKIGDLRWKVKRSLRPLEEQNASLTSAVGTPPKSKVSRSSKAFKLPPPPLATPGSPAYHTPLQTPKSCYHTPSLTRSRLRSSGGSSQELRVTNTKRSLRFEDEENNSKEKVTNGNNNKNSSPSNDEKPAIRKGVGAWLKQMLY